MDSSSVFARVVDAYAAEGFPHRLIGQWTLPENDVDDLVATVRTEAPKNILEVGTFVGLSTMIMALSSDDARIVTIDPNLPLRREMGSMGSELGDIGEDVTTLAVAARVARRLGVEGRVEFIEGGFSSSATFSSRRRDPKLAISVVGPDVCQRHGPFDLAFIDGLHYADVVDTDLELASSHMEPQGIILMHDCVGMWGTNVRTGIGRFLDRTPDWGFLHHPYDKLYRSIGTIFRRDHRVDLTGELLQRPVLCDEIASSFKALATSLVERMRPALVFEVGVRGAILAPHFEGLVETRFVDLASAGVEDLARVVKQTKTHEGGALVVSAGAPDLMEEAEVIALFRVIANIGATAVFLRTPPGERGAACRFSRPLRSWLRIADAAEADLQEAPVIDLAPSRFLFKRPTGAAPTTSLCHAVLLTARATAGDATPAAPVLAANADSLEQDATLWVHYASGYNNLFGQLDSLAAAQAHSEAQTEQLRATVSEQNESAENLERQLTITRASGEFWQSIACADRGDSRASEISRTFRAVSSALAHAAVHGASAGVCITLDRTPCRHEIAAYLDRPAIAAVCVPDLSAVTIHDQLDQTRIGGGQGGENWQLPLDVRRVYFVGNLRRFPRQLLETCWRRGIDGVFVRVCGLWVRISLGAIHRSYVAMRTGGMWWHSLRERLHSAAQKRTPALAGLILSADEAFQRMVTKGIPPGDFERGRVVHVVGNLSPGGAERQCANTVVGLAKSKLTEPYLLAHHLQPGPGRRDFHLARVQAAGVEVREIERVTISLDDSHVPDVLREVSSAVPKHLLFDIANLVREFERLRPEIVHCWLDWDNVRAGLAAVIAGVPKVIISGRNLAPINFKLYQHYMGPAYRALAMVPRVQIINNSRAGADSYADWIGIDRKKVSVVYNGFESGSFGTLDVETGIRVRRSLGLAQSDFVVGGVFRFEEEKRPLLWIEAACLAAQELPTARFVLYGQGSLRDAIVRRIAVSDHTERFILPGVTDDPLEAMAGMDVFMLTSFGEGLPNVLIEAQAAGAFIITSPAGGAPEAIEPGVTGWVCEGDAVRLANCIVCAYHRIKVRSEARLMGPHLVSERFGIERMIGETMKLYSVNTSTSLDREDAA